MTITSIDTVDNILNRAASELGLDRVESPFASTEKHFAQMKDLLQSCGEELCLAYPWEFLTEEYQDPTAAEDSGDYDLPSNYHYMIGGTGWERANNVPLFGPLTPQDWTYLLGRDLVGSTIYASFRLKAGQFSIFPQPPPAGLDINFEYQRRTWVLDNDGTTYKDDFDAANDKPLFDRTLLILMLKLKFLEAKGFDTTKAQGNFNQVFSFLTGKDKSGGTLNVGGGGGGFPYLDARRNVGDTNFGS